jgi:hypothetical protein
LAGLLRGADAYVPSRPSLDDHVWNQVDRALDEAIAASEVRLIVALAPNDAEDVARQLYVWAEPGPNVIALGHEDRSVSWHIDRDICAANEAPLRALLEDAGREVQRGDLASALLSIASNIRRLRCPSAIPPLCPPPIPRH